MTDTAGTICMAGIRCTIQVGFGGLLNWVCGQQRLCQLEFDYHAPAVHIYLC